MNKSTKAGLIAFALTAGALVASGVPASAQPEGPGNVCDTNMHWGNEGCKGPGGGGDDGT